MTVTKPMDLRLNIKKYLDLAFSGEAVYVHRKEDKNVVVISQSEFEELQKARNNEQYLLKLDRSYDQLKNGNVVVKSMQELRAMEE